MWGGWSLKNTTNAKYTEDKNKQYRIFPHFKKPWHFLAFIDFIYSSMNSFLTSKARSFICIWLWHTASWRKVQLGNFSCISVHINSSWLQVIGPIFIKRSTECFSPSTFTFFHTPLKLQIFVCASDSFTRNWFSFPFSTVEKVLHTEFKALTAFWHWKNSEK
jgi:hypothetical protein